VAADLRTTLGRTGAGASFLFLFIFVLCSWCSVSVRVSFLHLLSGRSFLVGGGGSRFTDLGCSASVSSSDEFSFLAVLYSKHGCSFFVCCFVFLMILFSMVVVLNL
jgi:hypothetical protein